MSDPAPLFPVSRVHFDELSAGIGIMQHAIGRRPDPEHGSCTDDVARALQVDLLHGVELGWTVVAGTAGRSLRFLEAAFQPRSGRFRNFRSIDGEWLDTIGSEDAHARAALALSQAAAGAGDPAFRAAAAALFERSLAATVQLDFLRPRAAALLACEVGAGTGSAGSIAELPRLLGEFMQATEPFDRSDRAWPWPEPVLTYENGLVPRALIAAGARLGDAAAIRRGLDLLAWLVGSQTAPEGHFSPIGNDGWWPRGGRRARYDQQPMEATALLLAAEAAYAVTREPRHLTTMDWAYAWFLGRNDGRCAVALPAEGAGQDGLTRTGANTNQGAESTLMWLIALERTRSMRRASIPALARSDRPGVRQVAAPA